MAKTEPTIEGDTMNHNTNIQSTQNERFTTLLLENQYYLYNFIYAFVGDKSHAEDLFQETAIVMCRKFEQFDPESNFMAWGCQIARNKIMNFRKQQKKTSLLFKDGLFLKMMSRSERLSENNELKFNALQSCIEKLSDKDNQLLKIRYESGLKVKEISEKIGRPVHGLYKAFSRILDSLRLCIQQEIKAGESA